MKTKLLVSLTFVLMTLFCTAQQSDRWKGTDWMTGQWQGEGNGQPGQGGGTYTFAPDLDKNILVRKSHSEYQSNDKTSVITHDDLMIIYNEPNGSSLRAVYFDNEGHVINYSVTVEDKSIIFLSEKQPNTPVFRLIYDKLDNSRVNVKFEMSSDGVNFNTYIEGISKRIK